MQSDNEILNSIWKSYNYKSRINMCHIFFECLYSNGKAIAPPWLQHTSPTLSVCCKIQISNHESRKISQSFSESHVGGTYVTSS